MKNILYCLLIIGIIPFIIFSSYSEAKSLNEPNGPVEITKENYQEKNRNISVILSGGITYSMLHWTTKSEGNLNRKTFSIKPAFNVRLLRRFNKFSLEPFIGYTVFGGKSNKEENDYEDQYWFYSLEYGSVFMYKLPLFDIGIGLKGNTHIKSISRYYGSLYADNNGAEWEREDWTNEFPRASLDLGITMQYSYNRFLVGTEIWGSLTNLLYKSIFDAGGSSARKLNFLLFAGIII